MKKILAASFAVLLGACASIGVSHSPYPYSELVMSPGDSITAVTRSGTITIRADDSLKRTYSWEGASRSARLWPRKKRWYGSLGAYYPGPGSHWASVSGVTRGVVEEGQMHFATMDEALKWLNMPWHKTAGAIYNDSGLFVLFLKSPGREQITVDVFQIYIGGRKPNGIPGSRNGAIRAMVK